MDTTFVSLGSTCATAYYLTSIGKRQISLPFDWTRTSLEQINNVLLSSFKYFSDFTIDKFSSNHLFYTSDESIINKKNQQKGSFILTNKYNIRFAHELLEKHLIHELKEKINKRIKCLLEMKNNKITFIRYEEKKQKKNYNDELNKLFIMLNKFFTDYNVILLLPESYKITVKKSNLTVINYNNPYTNWKNTDAFCNLSTIFPE